MNNYVDIDSMAQDLSEKLNDALDIIAPKKFFTIRPNYVQGLSASVKKLMQDQDQARSNLRNQNLTFAERKSLTMKYRKLRNKANEMLKRDKKAANAERIAKAKSESEVWKIISDITNPSNKEEIKIFVNDILISDEKEVADKFNEFFVDKIKNLKDNIDPSKIVDPLLHLKKKMSKKNLKFELQPVSVNTVMKTMGKMKMKKSAGADEISQECLLLGKSTLASPLTAIINILTSK